MSASLAPECNEIKERYDTCFLKWYSDKYLRGSGTDNNECTGLFKEYRKCLEGALKSRGIDKLLDEAREDNKENDNTHMGRKCKPYEAHAYLAQADRASEESRRRGASLSPLSSALIATRREPPVISPSTTAVQLGSRTLEHIEPAHVR